MARHTPVIADRMTNSGMTSERPAPSFMIFRAAVKRWVRGKVAAIHLIHWGAPSMENQTSNKNIMGQEIKFRTPLVNSSLVPLDANTSPMEVRLRHPRKKTTARYR